MAETNGTALAVREGYDLSPRIVVSLADLRENLRQLEEFKRDIMTPEVDYGTIPGTPKPTLLKPGAEKLALAFALSPTFEAVNRVEDWEHGFFHYEERCVLTSRRTGDVVASASGSANSREPRYRWRDARPTCPDCGMELRRSKRRDGDTEQPGWYCWARTGGCGATWPKETVKVIGRVENPEPWELANTVLKMAQKRALVAGVLIATGGSGIWTQDVEDAPSEVGDRGSETPYVPTDVREVGDQPRPQQQQEQKRSPRSPSNTLTSADEQIWQRWLELKREAEGLGVVVPEFRLPVGRQILQSEGLKVREAVYARRKQLAEQDAAGSRPMVTSKSHALWKEWLEAEATARAAGLQLDTAYVTLPVAEEALQAALTTLREAIADKAKAEELEKEEAAF